MWFQHQGVYEEPGLSGRVAGQSCFVGSVGKGLTLCIVVADDLSYFVYIYISVCYIYMRSICAIWAFHPSVMCLRVVRCICVGVALCVRLCRLYCAVMSRHVLSRLINVTCCHVLSRLVMSCHVLSCFRGFLVLETLLYRERLSVLLWQLYQATDISGNKRQQIV